MICDGIVAILKHERFCKGRGRFLLSYRVVLLVEDRDADGGHQAVAGELVLPRLGSLQRCEGGVGEGEREKRSN